MIYIVTSGCYSDYSINAVFDNKEDAELYATAFEDSNVEEWELGGDPEMMECARQGMHPWTVTVRSNDRTFAYRLNDVPTDRNKVYKYHWPNITSWTCRVMARDREHAIKIGNDLIAMYKAEA